MPKKLIRLQDFRDAIREATTMQELAQVEAEARKTGALNPNEHGETNMAKQLKAKREELANG